MFAGVSRDESASADGTPGKDTPTRGPADQPADADAAGASTRQQLIVVCGLPGVGKTTVAARVAELIGGDVLRTDAVRKDLFSEPEYTEAESRAVYEELFTRAAQRLAGGGSVVLDATFKRRRSRRNVVGLSRATDVAFRTIKVECDQSVVEARIETREGLSDADFEIHRKFREEYESLEIDHRVVDNSGSEAATLEQVDGLFPRV